MTAHELARILLAGPDVMVTVRGYEGGVNEITEVEKPESLALKVHSEWYYGEHEYANHEPELAGKEIVTAIHIG